MAYAPLVMKGTPEINGTDVSDQVTEIMFSGSRDSVTIPATFGTDESFAAGDVRYEATISFLPDVDTAAISEIFLAALADSTGTVTIAGTMRAGAVSATNPKYTATAIVTGWNIGGDVNSVSTDSQTFPLTAAPTKETT